MVIHELYLSTDGGNSQVKQEGYLKKRPRTDVRRANDTWAWVGSRTRALGGGGVPRRSTVQWRVSHDFLKV